MSSLKAVTLQAHREMNLRLDIIFPLPSFDNF